MPSYSSEATKKGPLFPANAIPASAVPEQPQRCLLLFVSAAVDHAPAGILAPLIFAVTELYQMSPVANGSGSPAISRIDRPFIPL